MNVSVVILTYKRLDELLRTIQSVIDNHTDPLEIIVVNNNDDDTDSVLKEKFPKIKCITMQGNKGCEARNIGVDAAKGEIVITIDNDVHIDTNGFAKKVVDFFNRQPEAGCVNFQVLRPDGSLSLRDWCHPRDEKKWSEQEFLTDHISEGASAFRKEAFLNTGGYYAPFFIGHEGPDLSLQLIKAGYEVWYTPKIKVVHHASLSARPSWRAYYYNTRNNIWLAYRHYPTFHALKYVTFYSLMMFFYSLKNRHLGAFTKGIADAVKGLQNIERSVAEDDAYQYVLRIASHRPSVISKLRKHLLSKQDYR